MGNTVAILTTYVLFRQPAGCRSCSFALFDSFLEARAYARLHPEMMEEEIEAESMLQAQVIASYLVNEQRRAYHSELYREEYDAEARRMLFSGY